MNDTCPILGQFLRGGLVTDIKHLRDAPPTYRTPRPAPPVYAVEPSDAAPYPWLQVDEWRRTGHAEGTITVLAWMQMLPDAPLPEFDHGTHEIAVRWVRYELDEPSRPRLTREDVDKLGEVLPNGMPAYHLDPYRGVIRSEEGRLFDELVEIMSDYDRYDRDEDY